MPFTANVSRVHRKTRFFFALVDPRSRIGEIFSFAELQEFDNAAEWYTRVISVYNIIILYYRALA